MEIGEV